MDIEFTGNEKDKIKGDTSGMSSRGLSEYFNVRKLWGLKLKFSLISILAGLILISPVFNFQTFKMAENGSRETAREQFSRSFIKLRAEAALLPTSVIITICGNEILEAEETCDDGTDNGRYGPSIAGKYCNSTCTGFAAYCGDGTLQSNYGEECDDGNNTSGDGCRSDCKTEAAPPPSGGGGGMIIPPPVPTRVVLQGKAYPNASLTVLYDGKVAIIADADSRSNFKVEITDITAGVYTFGLWAEDKKGRRSITFSFTTTVTKGAITTVSNIFIPPTIELEKVNILRGEIVNIFGQTVPVSEVSLHIESPEEMVKKTKADEFGDWDYPLDTSPLGEGSHIVRGKAETSEGLLSSFSKVLGFYIGKYTAKEVCPRADFNQDGKTNLVDFSIMLYWWGKYNPCVDQGQDGLVNLRDFSILMYWWTG